MWSRLTNLAQTVQGQLEDAVEETATTSSQEQLQSSTTTTVRRMVVHREVTLSSGSTLSIQELREQFDQQQLQIEQLKHLVRENEQQLKIKHKELEETNAKFSKFKLQAKAKSISEKKEENKKSEAKTQVKGSDHNAGGTSEQASRGKLLVVKKKLEDKEKLLIEKVKELSIKNNLLTEQERHLQERVTIIEDLNMQLKHLQDSITQESGGTPAHSKESSDSQQMFAQIVYKDNKILELNNKILQQDQNVMSLQEHVKEKEEVIQARTKAIQLVQKEITEKDQQLEDQNAMVQKLTKHVEQDEEQLSLLREQLQLKDDQLQQETEQFSIKLQETQKYFEETLNERNNVVESLHQKLEELNARYQQDKQVWSRRAKENIQDEALYRLEQRMKEKDDIIDAKNEVIEHLQKEKSDKEKHFIEESLVLQQNFKTFESESKAEKHKFELILKDVKENHKTELNEKVTIIKEFEKQIETLKLPVAEQLDKSRSEKQELLQRISEMESELITKEHLVNQLKVKAEEPSSGKSGAKFLKYKAQSTAKIKALQAELDNLKQDSNLGEELVSLKNQIAELEDDKVQCHNQVLELKEKLERQNGDLDQYIQALGKVEKDKLSMLEYIQKLEGTLQKGKFEQDAQQETLLLALKEELEQTRQFVVQVQEERDQERKERINFEMKLVEYQDYKKHAEIDIINLNEKLEEHQCEIAQLQNQLAGQEALKIRLEEEKVALELKLVELEEQTEGVEVQKLELIKETCRLQEHLEYEKQPNIAFETEKEELLKQLEVLRIQQQVNDEVIISQLQELKDVNENFTLQISRITVQVGQLKEENQNLETAIKNKDSEINELQTFKVMVGNLNSELSLKSQELHAHSQLEENLKSQIDDLQTECRQMENELCGLTSSSASTENSLKIVSEEINNKNSELQILKEKLEHEAAINRKYESHLAEYKHNISILENNLLEKSDITENLQFEINKLYNAITTFEEEKEQISVVYKEQMMEVQNALDVKDQKLNEYETELKHIQLECHQKETLLKELDNKLQISHEEVSTLQHKQSVGDKQMETKMNSFLQQMSEMESEVSSLQEKNNENEYLRVNLQDQLEKQKSELIHCKRELEEKETTLTNTKQMLEEMAINLQEKDNNLKQLEEEYIVELESSKQKLAEFSQIREKDVIVKSNINSQLGQNSVKISQLESILSERERNIEGLNSEMSQNVLTINHITQLLDEKSHIEQSLRGHIEEIEEKFNSNSEVLVKLEDELNQSKLYIESLETIIQDKNEAVTATQNKLEESICKWQELQQLQQNIEQEKHFENHHVEQLNADLLSSKEQISILQTDLDKAKCHGQELELVQQNLEQEKQQLQQTCIEMAQKYTTLEFEVECLNTSVRDYQNNVELSQESVNKLQTQMDQQKEIIQELQRELHSNIQQREVADVSRVETENKNKQLHETITKLKVGLKKHLKEKDELVSKLENMEVEKAQYMQEKQHFEEEVQQLQSARLEMLEVNNQQLTEQIRTLEVEAEHNKMSKNELAALLDKQELEKQQLLELKLGLEESVKSQKEETNQQIKSLEDECHSKEEVVLKLNDQIHLFEEELKQCKKEINNQKRELEILDLKRQELEIELKQTTDHLQMLQSSSSEHVQTLSSELEKANEEIKNLNIKIITVSNQAKESKQKSDNYKTEMNKLHSELDHTLAGVAQFKTENHILKEQLNQADNLKTEFQIKYKEKLEQSEADRDHILLLERKIIKYEQLTESVDKSLIEKDLKLSQLEDISTQLKVLQEENNKLLTDKDNILLAISKKDDDLNLLERNLLQSQELLEKSHRNITNEKEMMVQNKLDFMKELETLKSEMLQKETELKKEIEFLTEEKNRSNLEWEKIVEENKNNSEQMSTELKHLKQYVNELESEKINQENIIAKLQETLEEEKKTKLKIEKELENVNEYLNILQSEREKLQEDMTDYDKRVQILQLELQTIGEDLTMAKSELLVSQDKSQKSVQTIASLQNEIVQLQQQGNQREDSIALNYNQMQINMDELLKALEEKNKKLDVMGNDYLQLKKQYHQLNEELAQNIHEKNQLQNIVEITQQNKRQDEELSFFKEQCAQFAIVITQLEKEKEEFKLELEQERHRVDKFALLEKQCTRLKSTIVELTSDKENLEDMLKKYSQPELSLEKSQSVGVEILLQEEHNHMSDKTIEEESNIAEMLNECQRQDEYASLKEQIICLERDKQELQTLVQQKEDIILELEKSQMERETAVSETWVEKTITTHLEKEQLVQSDSSEKKNNQNYETLIKEHEELKLLYDKIKIKSEKMLIKLKQFKDRHDKIQEELKASHQEIEHLKSIHVQNITSHEEMIKGFEIRVVELREQVEIAELQLNKQNKMHLVEVSRLQSSIKNLEEELESLHNDFKTLKSDYQKLLREKEYIEKEKEKINAENWKLTEQFEQNKQQYEEREIQDGITIEGLRSQANENMMNMQIEAGNKERYERELRTTLEQMEQLTLDNENFQTLVENLTTVKIKLEEEIKNQQKSNVALSLENQQLKDGVEKWKSVQTDKKDSTEKLVEDLNRIRLELELVQNKYDELKLHSDDLVYKKETLENENRQGQKTLLQINILNEQLHEQIVALQQENNEFRQEIEILNDEKEQLLFQFANVKHELESLLSEKEKIIHEHSYKVDDHLEENMKLEKELASVQIDYQVLLLEKEQEIEKSQSAEECYLQQVSELQQRDIKLTAEVVSLRQTSLEFKQQYNLIETECEHLRNLLQQRDNHIVSATKLLDKLKIENSQMTAELKHWNSQRQEMAQGSANLQPTQDPEVLQEEFQQAMQSLHLRESRIEQLTSHIAQLLEEKSSLSMQLSSTSRLKQERDAQIFAIQNQYRTLETAMRQKQDEINTLQRHLQIKSPRVETAQQLPSSNVDPAQMHVLLKRLETSEHLQKTAEERNVQLEEQLITEREQRLELEDKLNRTQEKLQRESQPPLIIPDFILSMDSEEQNPKILETSHTLTRQVRSHASKIQKWLSRRNPLSRALRSRSALHILYLFYVIFLHVAVLHCYLF